ncbi:MAG: HAMP domain-containing protein, partial [Nitrospirae bacterium]|nr:HAMP domain-containing protein [Nitrospirota bacterium]
MPYKIRTKLIIAFFAVIFPFLIIMGGISLYNMNTIYKKLHRLDDLSNDRMVVTSIMLAFGRVLMPVNDYIITGDRRYIDDFKGNSIDLEARVKEMELELGHAHEISEKELFKKVNETWQNIREISFKIFAVPDPRGNKDAAKLMEDMDYKYAYPIIEVLKKWRDKDIEEYKESVAVAEKAWVEVWVIMIVGAVILIGTGVFFAFYYSKIFVRPIEIIHNGADAIAHGDFKTRLDIKTGDEIEQLSDAMNEMSAQLDSLYSNMQAMVDERTLELKESEERFRSVSESAPDAII